MSSLINQSTLFLQNNPNIFVIIKAILITDFNLKNAGPLKLHKLFPKYAYSVQ